MLGIPVPFNGGRRSHRAGSRRAVLGETQRAAQDGRDVVVRVRGHGKEGAHGAKARVEGGGVEREATRLQPLEQVDYGLVLHLTRLLVGHRPQLDRSGDHDLAQLDEVPHPRLAPRRGAVGEDDAAAKVAHALAERRKPLAFELADPN